MQKIYKASLPAIILLMSLTGGNAAAIESCDKSGSACVTWNFIDEQGNPSEQPQPIVINIDTNRTYAFKWEITDHRGDGFLKFRTTTNSVTSGDWIENCTHPGPSTGFSDLVDRRGADECVLEAHGGEHTNNLKLEMDVSAKPNLPFQSGAPAETYDIPINVVPEFGVISALIIVGSIFALITAFRIRVVGSK
jgi:hypothetical protein